MKYNPHNYQIYATEFIESHNESAILLSMGLGKTIITLTAINDLLFDSFDVNKVLIIAPLRVAKTTWKDEIEKWEHLKLLKYSIIVGTELERISALKTKADIYIINRENVSWLVEESGCTFKFDMIVVDELSSFKNGKSKRFQSLMKVRPLAKRIVGLTGTPASNGLMDLWSEYKLLDYGKRLGRFITHYRNNYFAPDRRNGTIIYSYKPLPFAEETIYDKISDITISMTSNDYLQMPDLIKNEVKVEMSEEELTKYKALQNDLVLSLDDDDISASSAGILSNKLSQMANGAIYTEDHISLNIHNRKLDALEDLIEQAYGKPVLVAYWFKHDLERISKRLKELNIPFEEIKTESAIRKWNEGKVQVGLIHPASAGHGLNLQSGGSTLIWFGLTWSLELYEQTNARLYRQGQKASTVVIEHIITKGTIDEEILKALERKDCVQGALINAVKVSLKGR